ncbi:hypothetical protein B0H13DRAFT_1578339, partial [Mycena leptocephala]
PLLQSPPLLTPSKLQHFLEHAQQKLGVKDALQYENALEAEGYGPDILHLVDDSDLIKAGLRAGDVIRLKAGAQKWWTGPNAKRKRDAETDDHDTQDTNKKVSFEYRSPGGGMMCYYGPRMTPRDPTERAKNSFYRCE